MKESDELKRKTIETYRIYDNKKLRMNDENQKDEA